MSDREQHERAEMAAQADQDAARLEGFCDCEALAVAMAQAMADAASVRETAAECAMVDALDDDEAFDEAAAAKVKHGIRAAVLREFALALSLGRHRTDEYDPDAVVAAHRAVVNRSQASAAGKGNLKRSEEARRESARNAANARWGKKEPK